MSMVLLLVRLSALLVAVPEPPTVDLCYLFERPPEYRGRIVRVSGTFMQAVLWKECGERFRQERLCVDYAEPASTTSSSSTEDSSGREVVAVAEASLSELSEASAENRLSDFLDALKWTPLVYEAAEFKKGELWRDFVDARSAQGSFWNVTLVGRFEYVNKPSFILYSDGSRAYVTGYGLRGTACRSRIVITQVESVKEADP